LRKKFFSVSLLLSACLLLPISAQGQAAAPPKNGYLELVRAGNILMGSTLFLSKIRETGSFADHAQEVLRNPDVQEAQRLLRVGLQKPIKLLDDGEATDVESFLAAQAEVDRFPQLRILTALCAVENASALKEGRFEDGLNALKHALRLREVVQGKSLVTWKVGRSMLGMVTRSINIALPTSTALQCSLYRSILEPILSAPSSLLPPLEIEERRINQELNAIERGSASRKEELETLKKRDTKLARDVQAHLKKREQEIHNFLERVRVSVEVYFINVRSSISRPASERERAIFPDKETPEGKLFQLIVPNYSLSLSLHDQDVLTLRMTLLHSRLQQYKAETGSFPDSLDSLQAEALLLDPFTGKPFIYQKAKDTFTLNLPKLDVKSIKKP